MRTLHGVVVAALLSFFAACGGTTVTQLTSPTQGNCQPTLAGIPSSVPATGASVTGTVSTTRDCVWTVTTSGSWIQINPTTGQGQGSISVVFGANGGSTSRSATISINGTSTGVVQGTNSGGGGNPGSVSFGGRISDLSGQCPSVGFTAGGYHVVTDPGTAFIGGDCGDLENRVRVSVSGQVQNDGSVYATRVTIR